MTAQRPFTVLTVCRGNISRSPAAEHLLRSHLDGRFSVASAGVGAHMVQGDPMDRWTLAMLGKLGVDGRGHRARQLARPLIERAELILAMSLDQRSWIAAEVPQALPRTFTLREFARLAVAVRGFQSQSVAEMIGRAAANRAVYPVAPGGSDEIRDPAGGTLDDFRAAFEAVRQCSVQIARELNGHDRLRGVVAPVRRSVRLAF